jgi:hypothetical protein
VGASKNIFEALFLQSQEIDPEAAEEFLSKALGPENKFWKFALKIKKSLA